MFDLMIIVTVGVLIFLLLLLILPQKIQYALSGIILIAVGVLPFLVS